jgi:hypothetical protein
MARDNRFETIKHGKMVIAMIVPSNYKSGKTRFFSPAEFSQQLGYIVHKKGGIIKAHFHRPVHRKITLTQEVLFVRRGRLSINFYAPGRKFLTSRQLSRGDTVFLCGGGHGLKMLEDCELIEVKQGPYSGKASDKEIFEGIEHDTGK